LLVLVDLSWLVTGGDGHGTHPEDWELVVKLLWLRVFQSVVVLVPSCTLQEETVDQNTLAWYVELLALDSSIITVNNLFPDFRIVLDLIKRPVLGLLLSCNLLLHRGQETLWVEESGHPE